MINFLFLSGDDFGRELSYVSQRSKLIFGIRMEYMCNDSLPNHRALSNNFYQTLFLILNFSLKISL